MRTEEFKMERPGLLKEGETVEIIEKNTVAFYYYRIKSTNGVVKGIRKNEKGYFVDVEFEE